MKSFLFPSRRAWLAAAMVLSTGLAQAQTQAPAQPLASGKPITLMVPYPAGGPSDAAGRVFTAPLGQALGQQVVVENLGGATGAIAAQKVLAAPADGQYLFQGSPNEVILAPLVNAAVKSKPEDFRLVVPMADAVMVVVARKDLPANSMDELIALARKSPQQPLSYGSVGIGSLYHLILERVQQLTRISLNHAPYKGNAPLLQDLGGGQVDFAVLVYSAAMGALADQGRLKVIGQLGPQRSELLPKVPTVSEGQELKGFNFKTWSGFFVPKKTPDAVVQRLHQAIGKALADPAVQTQLAAQTQVAAAPMSLADAQKFFETETARYRDIAKSINLQPQ